MNMEMTQTGDKIEYALNETDTTQLQSIPVTLLRSNDDRSVCPKKLMQIHHRLTSRQRRLLLQTTN